MFRMILNVKEPGNPEATIKDITQLITWRKTGVDRGTGLSLKYGR